MPKALQVDLAESQGREASLQSELEDREPGGSGLGVLGASCYYFCIFIFIFYFVILFFFFWGGALGDYFLLLGAWRLFF